MNVIGKLLGAIAGFLMGGPIGLLIGLGFGHLFDRGLARASGVAGATRRQIIHTVFFQASFRIMGHVAKADGRVSEAEVAAAERVMAHMRLTQSQREQAISLFQEGKRDDFDLEAELNRFLAVCRRQPNVLRMFIEIQLEAALADGQVDDAERSVLRRIAGGLGLSDADFERLEALLQGGQRRASAQGGGPDLDEAYRELGVSREATDAEVKGAYRRLMSQHHPDKLVARGLPEEMAEVAKERTQEIQAAWDTVRRDRGIR